MKAKELEVLQAGVEALKAEIERRQGEWRKNPCYDGSMTDGVVGMIESLSIVTGKPWTWRGEELVTFE